MRYLEDTLAEKCLSETLYPKTKIYVRRKKVDGSLINYTNELDVEIDFSDVDPRLLDGSTEETNEVLDVPKLTEESSSGLPKGTLPTNSPNVKARKTRVTTDNIEVDEKDTIVEIQGSDLDDDPKKGGFLRSIFTRKKEK
jgi:hypothetical protein